MEPGSLSGAASSERSPAAPTPPAPAPRTSLPIEITWQAVVGAAAIPTIISAAYPYVVLKIGLGPNVSVVSAFLGAIFLNFTARATRGRNRLANNIIQTAGTSASATAFMCVVAAAFGYLDQNATVDVHVHITRLQMFMWLTLAGAIGVFFTVLFRKMFLDDPAMVFADGVAAAETMVVLDTAGSEAQDKTRALSWSALVSAAVNFVVEGVPAFFGKELVPYLMFSTRFRMGLDWSLLNIGTGLLVGLRMGVSMMLGSFLIWFVIGPYVMNSGIGLSIVQDSIAPALLDRCRALAALGPGAFSPDQAREFGTQCGLYPQYAAGDHFRIVMLWAMWPATAMMVTAALTAVLFEWRAIAATFRDLRAAKSRGGRREDISPRTILVGGTICAVLLAVVQKASFGMSYTQTLVAVAASLPLMLVGIRVLGETNQGPISVMANALQAVFAVFWPSHIGVNLVAAGVSGSISTQSEGTIQDYKTGKIVGSTPRVLTWVQLAAVPIGAAAVAIMYPLLIKIYGLGQGLTAPTGLKIANMAVLLSKGFRALPEGAFLWTAIAAVAGVALSVCSAKYLWGRYLPAAAGFGFALILPGTLNIPMAIGGILAWAWETKYPDSYGRYCITVASGFIAGEALLGGVVTPIVLTLMR